jgi:hypothetical protein
MNHELLMALTASMPMKQIDVNDAPYLQRYFVGYAKDGGSWWYHRFLRADAERHLHTHPWTGRSFILCGHYIEQLRPPGNTNDRNDRRRYFNPGMLNQIFPSTLHRIVEIEPDTWTLLYIAPGREPTWKFIADDGAEIIMQSSPENWHEKVGPRP